MDDPVEPVSTAVVLVVAVDGAGEVLRPLTVFGKDVGACLNVGAVVVRQAQIRSIVGQRKGADRIDKRSESESKRSDGSGLEMHGVSKRE